MDKNCRNDIAAFPELFAGMEQFTDELGLVIRRMGLQLAVLAIPGSALLLFALSKAA
jgi:hypothetical protein